jgi:DNA polymerase-3 subunit gamma/tau
VSVVGSGGGATLAETRAEEEDALRAAALAHPLVQAALKAFPGATLTAVRRRAPIETEMLADPEDPGADEGDWEPVDPFEEEN